MERALSFLAGAGAGAGFMYLLDPNMGRRRRAMARDTAGVVARDMRNRAQGLAAGDLSVLAGGKRALTNPLRGSWSPSARAIMTAVGGGLFLYALTRSAPMACILGTAGLALAAEGITNAGIDDLLQISGQVAETAGNMAESIGEGLGSAVESMRPQEQPV